MRAPSSRTWKQVTLHFALEFARCPYRILQINYVDVDVDVDVRDEDVSLITRIRAKNSGEREDNACAMFVGRYRISNSI